MYKNQLDEDLVPLAQAGDQQAKAELYNRHVGWLSLRIKSLCNLSNRSNPALALSSEDISDTVTDVILAGIAGWQPRVNTKLKTFLNWLAEKRWIDQVRRRQRQVSREVSLQQPIGSEGAETLRIEDTIADENNLEEDVLTKEQIRSYMEKLRAQCGHEVAYVVFLYYLRGLTYAEIGSVLDVSTTSAYTKLKKGEAALQGIARKSK